MNLAGAFQNGIVELHVPVRHIRRLRPLDRLARLAQLGLAHEEPAAPVNVLDRPVPVRMRGEARIGRVPGAAVRANAEIITQPPTPPRHSPFGEDIPSKQNELPIPLEHRHLAITGAFRHPQQLFIRNSKTIVQPNDH